MAPMTVPSASASGRSRSASPAPLSPRARRHYDMLHRPATGQRPVSAFSKVAAAEESEVPVVTQKEVRRDVFGKKVYDGPKFVPGDRAMQWNPEHTDRAAVFKEDLAIALKSDDVPTVMAVYSMAFDMDAMNANSQLMFTSTHEVEAIQKHLRRIMKKQINLAIEAGDVDALKVMFEEIDKDRLLKAVSIFPEVVRGRAYLNLRTAHLELESHNTDDEEAKMKKMKALQGATRNARPVRGMSGYIEESRNLMARQRELASAPPKKANSAGSLPSTAASDNAEDAEASGETSAVEDDAVEEEAAGEDDAVEEEAAGEDDAVEEESAEEY